MSKESVDRALMAKYGITMDGYRKLLKSQNYCCKICYRSPDPKKRLSIDHCHETGIIRGLICSACNLGLGNFKDSIALLDNAVYYLRAFEDEKDRQISLIPQALKRTGYY